SANVEEQRLIDTANEVAAQIVEAASMQSVFSTALNAILDNFDYEAGLVCFVKDGKVYAETALPEHIATDLKARNDTVYFPEKCPFGDDWEWESHCPACRRCSGVTGIATLRKSTVVIRDTSTEEARALSRAVGISAKNEVAIPLVVQGTVWGVLDLYSSSA